MTDARAAPAGVVTLLRASHAVPTLVVTLVVLGLATAVEVATGVAVWRGVVLAAGVALAQLSVGLSNDWLDAALDRAAGRTDKPVANGDLAPESARTAAFAFLAAGALLPFAASWQAALLHLVFIACGWAYNLGLKRTVLSPVPYVIGFATLPSLATLLAPHPAVAPWWATTAGAAFGLAAHFANVVPDVDADRRAGVLGLPQRMGARAAGLTAPVVVFVATGVVAIGMRTADLAPALALAVAGLAALVGFDSALLGRSTRAQFRAVMLASLALVLAIALSGALV